MPEPVDWADPSASQAHKLAGVLALAIEETLPNAAATAAPDGPRMAEVNALVAGERFRVTVEHVR